MKLRLIWCLSLGVATIAGALWWLGFRPATILLALLLLACPAIIIWGAIHLYRDSRKSPRVGLIPHGKGNDSQAN